MKEAVIVAGYRTAVGRAKRGSTRNLRPELLAQSVIRAVLQATPQLDAAEIDDVILGCAMPEGAQGLNIARLAALASGLPESVPGVTINRFCASGLQSIAQACAQISAGQADVVLAGGVESMSAVPMIGFRFSPAPDLVTSGSDAYLSMGLTAERVAAQYQISRTAQDAFAYHSQQKAAAALAADKFSSEIVPVSWQETYLDLATAQPISSPHTLTADEHPRPATTLADLAKLQPAFQVNGTVTAGNASPLSDGAAAVLVMSAERAKQLGLQPLLRLVSYAVVGVAPGLMGIGPVFAIPKALQKAGLPLAEIDLIELNEAFAAQALAVQQTLDLDPAKLNVNGGAIALGHPLGCTGTKLTVQLQREMTRRQARYGLVSLCVGGGQGVAAIFERLN